MEGEASCQSTELKLGCIVLLSAALVPHIKKREIIEVAEEMQK